MYSPRTRDVISRFVQINSETTGNGVITSANNNTNTINSNTAGSADIRTPTKLNPPATNNNYSGTAVTNNSTVQHVVPEQVDDDIEDEDIDINGNGGNASGYDLENFQARYMELYNTNQTIYKENERLREDLTTLRIENNQLKNKLESLEKEHSSSRRMEKAVQDQSCKPFDMVKETDSTAWLVSFQGLIPFHHLDANETMLVFERKLAKSVREAWTTAPSDVKQDIVSAAKWLVTNFVSPDSNIVKQSEITNEKWDPDKESFPAFYTRFNAHFASYPSSDPDKIKYLIEALPDYVNLHVRTNLVSSMTDYATFSAAMINLPWSLIAKNKPTTKTSGSVNAVTKVNDTETSDNNQNGDVNFISRGKPAFRGNNYRGRPFNQRGRPNSEPQYRNYRGNQRGSFNRRQQFNQQQHATPFILPPALPFQPYYPVPNMNMNPNFNDHQNFGNFNPSPNNNYPNQQYNQGKKSGNGN